MPQRVCLDASLALLLLLPEILTPKVEAMWQSWSEENVEIVAPPLFFAEVTSVIRESVYFGRILPQEGEDAFAVFTELSVKAVQLSDLQSGAWALAKQYNRPRAYDAQYLAVASGLDCELWTADHRLFNAVRVPWLRWIGDHAGRSTPTPS